MLISNQHNHLEFLDHLLSVNQFVLGEENLDLLVNFYTGMGLLLIMKLFIFLNLKLKKI